MEYKILEAIGVENENVDGAVLNAFIARQMSGILPGVLNECSVSFDPQTVTVNTGELILHGFRVKITTPYQINRSASASTINHYIIAKIELKPDKSVQFYMDCRSDNAVTKDNLFVTNSGVYEEIIAQFTTDTTGVSSATRVASVLIPDSVDEYLSLFAQKEGEYPDLTAGKLGGRWSTENIVGGTVTNPEAGVYLCYISVDGYLYTSIIFVTSYHSRSYGTAAHSDQVYVCAYYMSDYNRIFAFARNIDDSQQYEANIIGYYRII